MRLIAGLSVTSVLASALIAQLIGWHYALAPVTCCDCGPGWRGTLLARAQEEIARSVWIALFASIVPGAAWCAAAWRGRRARS